MPVSNMIRPLGAEGRFPRSGLFPALTAALLYAAVWGCFSSMCGLSTLGILPLSAGFALIPALCLLPLSVKRQRIVLAAIIGVTLFLGLIRLPLLSEGSRRLLNRLFQASAARHPYLYDSFRVTGGPSEGIQWTLLVLGLPVGAWLGAFARRHAALLSVLPPVLLLCAMAWLGISPSAVWIVLLTAACVLCLLRPEEGKPSILIPAAIAGLTVLTVILLLPGRNEKLAGAEEAARDRLAPRTVWYGDLDSLERQNEDQRNAGGQSGKKPFHRLDETSADEGEGIDLSRALNLTLLILLVLLLLFGPALWSDRLKRRRAANRAGLDDPDARTDVCASFLYGMRCLREAGLIAGNLPFSAYALALSRVRAEFGARYAEIVPIWQEAAYSAHDLDEEQRRAVRDFRMEAAALAEEQMNWKQKLRARYITAL